jgi:multicomponent Na+:H+ antiporter subunit A
MLLAVLFGFLFSLIAPWFPLIARRWSGWLAASIPLGLTIYFSLFLQPVAAGEVFSFRYSWVPSLGVDLTFTLDGLSLLFALLISGMGVLVLIYSGSYLSSHPHLGRFYSYLLAFMASMLGVVLADNLIALFVFWELTSLSSYLLIGFNHEKEESRAAALQALLVTGAGGLSLLVGFLLLGELSGSLEFSQLLGRGEDVRSHALYVPLTILILIGAFTKSAQAPFHFWLPNAMEAPTPVSTYLHSATMVKAGVYLLARFSPVLGGTELWENTVTSAGVVTLLAGAYLALSHTDLKRVLAYSTVSSLGMLVLLLGIGKAIAVQAAMVFLVVHALYKGALFLIVGVLDHETGTREAERLRGLIRVMPITAFAAALAAFSNAGLPPLFGFIGKELIYEVAFDDPTGYLLIAAVLMANISFVAVAGIVGIRPFAPGKSELPRKPHEAPLGLLISPILLGAAGLWVGLMPERVAEFLITPAVASVRREWIPVELVLWHGYNHKLLLSLVSLVIGTGVCLGWRRFRWISSKVDYTSVLGPAQWYRLALKGLNAVARAQTKLLQSGHLHFYLFIIVVTACVLVGSSLFDHHILVGLARWSDIHVHEAVLTVLILSATMVVVRTQSRLAAVLALGVVGYGVALLFLLFSAPDLAMTQFSIETLSIILLVLVLFRLPTFKRYSKRVECFRDAVPSLAFGGLMTALVLSATALPREAHLAPYFSENSLPLAKGRNVVNVILVDFRAFDTLGEITVLAVAAIGVYSLLRLYTKKM